MSTSSSTFNTSIGSSALGSIVSGSSSTAIGSSGITFSGSTGTYVTPSYTIATTPPEVKVSVSIDPPSWSNIVTVEQTVVEANGYNNYNGAPFCPPYGSEILSVSAPYKKNEYDTSKAICIVYGTRYNNEEYREEIKRQVVEANKTATEWIKTI